MPCKDLELCSKTLPRAIYSNNLLLIYVATEELKEPTLSTTLSTTRVTRVGLRLSFPTRKKYKGDFEDKAEEKPTTKLFLKKQETKKPIEENTHKMKIIKVKKRRPRITGK